MRKFFEYNVDLSTLKVIKDVDRQFDKFFYKGHPEFLIPDFSNCKEDIWDSYLEYLEKDLGREIWDQDGGEIIEYQVIDDKTGLTKVNYTAYGIMVDEDSECVDHDIDIEGYVIQNGKETYFLTTKVEID
jgi:hypothetical protein